MSLNKNNKIFPTTLPDRLRQMMRTQAYRSPIYLATLGRRKAVCDAPLKVLYKSCDARRGRAILEGKFTALGRLYQHENDPWSLAPTDWPWQMCVHGFDWLSDLMSVEDARAIVQARQLIRHWMETYGQWDAFFWRADVLASRVTQWALWAEKISASADDDFKEKFYQSLGQQATLLMRMRFRDLDGIYLLNALRGQLYTCLMLRGYAHRRAAVLNRLSDALDNQILADGGHVSRAPSVLLAVLELCLEIQAVLKARHVEIPDALLRAVDRMAPMVRTLRHGDGSFGLFQGGFASTSDKIEHLLEATKNQGKPISDARHSGYQRLECGDTVILMDVGYPASAKVNPHAHAAPLSLEMSFGEERILVNCGAIMGGDPGWADALGATAAHNTLVIDDTNCFQLFAAGGVEARDVIATSKRFEENGHILIDARHDAYKNSFGIIHERSVYLNKTGDDLRVEDKIIGSGGNQFALCLHLHPDVQVSLLSEAQAALLKLANGSGWHLRVQGARIEVRESIYMPQPGEMHHNEQLFIHGPLRGDGADVKWRLSKIA